MTMMQNVNGTNMSMLQNVNVCQMPILKIESVPQLYLPYPNSRLHEIDTLCYIVKLQLSNSNFITLCNYTQGISLALF